MPAIIVEPEGPNSCAAILRDGSRNFEKRGPNFRILDPIPKFPQEQKFPLTS